MDSTSLLEQVYKNFGEELKTKKDPSPKIKQAGKQASRLKKNYNHYFVSLTNCVEIDINLICTTRATQNIWAKYSIT